MNITISERLKEYRRNKKNTQEALAEYVGISVQAVSKWERGESYPDITLLPMIATYYNVSIDELLGMGKVRQKAKIDEYFAKAQRCADKNDNDGERKVWEEAYREFPNDLSVASAYMYFLPDDNEKDAYEKIELAEKLIRESTSEENYAFSGMQTLCYTYRKVGNIEKAKEYASKLPHYFVTESQIMMTLLEGDEAVGHIQNNLVLLADIIWLNATNLAVKGKYSEDEKLRIYDCALKVYDAVYGDDLGFNYNRTLELYAKKAISYAKMKDADSAITNLAVAVEHAKKWAEVHPDGAATYSSPLVNRLKMSFDSSSRSSIAEWILSYMEESAFDFCRGDARYKEIKAEIEKLI
jgi:Predicted transcriptional regulators